MQANFISAKTNIDGNPSVPPSPFSANRSPKADAHLDEVLFDKFLEMLESKGIKPQDGTLVDATFVEVPRQHNTKEENGQIKNGKVPQSFEANKHKLAQKDYKPIPVQK